MAVTAMLPTDMGMDEALRAGGLNGRFCTGPKGPFPIRKGIRVWVLRQEVTKEGYEDALPGDSMREAEVHHRL